MTGLYFDSGIDRGFEKDLTRMNAKMNSFTGNVQKQGITMEKTFKRVGANLSAMVSILAIGAAGKEIIDFSKDLETALIEVATISTEVSENQEKYKDTLIELSIQEDLAASSAQDLAEAYYDIVSAGHDGAKGLLVLESAARAGTAGFVEASVAADGLTTVMNAWGKEAEDANEISDIFFTTVEKGKTTFPELGASIAQVAPIAASMGVSFEEVSGAVATITKQGTPTAQAMTQIRASLIAMNEVLGDGWSDAMTYQEGLLAVQERAGGSQNELKNLLGRVEAVNAVLALTGDNANGAAEDLEAMNSSLGATARAAEKVVNTTEHQIKTLKNNILAAFEPLGDAATNTLVTLAKNLNEAFQSGDVEKFAKAILLIAEAFVVYKVSLKAINFLQKINLTQTKLQTRAGINASKSTLLMAKANKSLSRSLKSVSKAFAANPIGLLVTSLTLAIPLVIDIAKSLQSASSKIEDINKEIGNTFGKESAGLNVLQDQLDNTNLRYGTKKELIEKLNKEYGKYLPSLLTEKSSSEEIAKAIAIANDNLKEQIRLRILNRKAIEADTAIYELNQKIAKTAILAAAPGITGDIFRINLARLIKNLENEKEAYDYILSQINEAGKKAAKKPPPPVTKIPVPTTELSDEDKEKRRKAALKALEIENQLRTNIIIDQYGREEALQREFDLKMLKNQLVYLKALRALTVDELAKLKIDEQLLNTQINIDTVSAENKEKEDFDKLLKKYQTYMQQRETIQKKYLKEIVELRNKDHFDEAEQAERALQRELKRLDKAILSSNEKFQEWLSSILPNIAKEGIEALAIELERLKKILEANEGQLSPEEVLVYTAEIDKLNKELAKQKGVITDSKDAWKDTLEVINGVNELAQRLIESFDGLDDSAKNILTGITEVTVGAINMGNAIKAAAIAAKGLDTASAILAVISTAIQLVTAVSKTFERSQQIRIQGYVDELTKVQAVNVALLEQNRLYAEGNELFTDDKWGTALAGLTTYNEALDFQNDLIAEINENSATPIEYHFSIGGVFAGFNDANEVREIKEEAQTYVTELEKALASVAIKTEDKGWFASLVGIGDEFESLLTLYPDVIKANGDLDTTILQTIVDSQDLGEADKERLTQLIELTNQAQDAYAQFGDYISSIFSGVGDDIAQAFQVMYESGDDAMTSLEGSFSDMIEAFTRDAIQFAFLQPYLEELNSFTKQLGEDYRKGDISAAQLQDSIINVLGDFYNSLNQLQPEILQAYENADLLAAQAGFDQAFNEDTADTADETSDALSRAGQISQAITEETGSMLVGRLGAIMLSNERISSFTADALDYAVQNLVYMKQIKLNTDYLPAIADNTRKTYEKLESV